MTRRPVGAAVGGGASRVVVRLPTSSGAQDRPVGRGEDRQTGSARRRRPARCRRAATAPAAGGHDGAGAERRTGHDDQRGGTRRRGRRSPPGWLSTASVGGGVLARGARAVAAACHRDSGQQRGGPSQPSAGRGFSHREIEPAPPEWYSCDARRRGHDRRMPGSSASVWFTAGASQPSREAGPRPRPHAIRSCVTGRDGTARRGAGRRPRPGRHTRRRRGGLSTLARCRTTTPPSSTRTPMRRRCWRRIRSCRSSRRTRGSPACRSSRATSPSPGASWRCSPSACATTSASATPSPSSASWPSGPRRTSSSCRTSRRRSPS